MPLTVIDWTQYSSVRKIKRYFGWRTFIRQLPGQPKAWITIRGRAATIEPVVLDLINDGWTEEN